MLFQISENMGLMQGLVVVSDSGSTLSDGVFQGFRFYGIRSLGGVDFRRLWAFNGTMSRGTFMSDTLL